MENLSIKLTHNCLEKMGKKPICIFVEFPGQLLKKYKEMIENLEKS
jgi:hypothetical protein